MRSLGKKFEGVVKWIGGTIGIATFTNLVYSAEKNKMYQLALWEQDEGPLKIMYIAFNEIDKFQTRANLSTRKIQNTHLKNMQSNVAATQYKLAQKIKVFSSSPLRFRFRDVEAELFRQQEFLDIASCVITCSEYLSLEVYDLAQVKAINSLNKIKELQLKTSDIEEIGYHTHVNEMAVILTNVVSLTEYRKLNFNKGQPNYNIKRLITDLEKCTEAYQFDNYKTHFLLGYLKIVLDLEEESFIVSLEDHITRAVRLAAKDPDVLTLEGLYFEKRNDPEKKDLQNAEGKYREALHLGTENPTYQVHLGRILLKQNKEVEGCNCLVKVLNEVPCHCYVIQGLQRRCEKYGDWKDCEIRCKIEDFEKKRPNIFTIPARLC
jgi:hypothetical protein